MKLKCKPSVAISALIFMVACGGKEHATPKTITAQRRAMIEKLEKNLLQDISPELHPIFEAIALNPSASKTTAAKYFQIIGEEYSASTSDQEEALQNSCSAADLEILNRGTDLMNDGIDLIVDVVNEFWMELGRAGIRQEMIAKMESALKNPEFESTISDFKHYFQLALHKPSDTEKMIRRFARSHGINVERLVQSYALAIDGSVSAKLQIIGESLRKKYESRARALFDRMQIVKLEGLSENCKNTNAKITERADARIKAALSH